MLQCYTSLARRCVVPRKSPYAIVLSSAEREQLQRLASSYTSPYCDVMRAKMILLAAEGLGNDEIALRTDSERQIVSKWRKRFFLERLDGLSDRPRRGMPGPPQRRRRDQSARL